MRMNKFTEHFEEIHALEWVAVPPDMVKMFGLEPAYFLAWVIWKMRDTDGEVVATKAQITEAIGLSPFQIDGCKRKLGAILSVREERLTHQTYYRVIGPELERAFEGSANEKTEAPEVKKPELPRSSFLISSTYRKNITKEQGKEHISADAVLPEVKKAKPVPEAKPAVKELIDGWCQLYQEQTGKKYLFLGAKDAIAAKRLSAAGAPAEVLDIARRAFNSPVKFWCSRAVQTLALFASRFNEVRAEVSAPAKPDFSKYDAVMSNL
jgi:hypothetical protein